MKAFFQKYFCSNALKDCLERESDLTKVIDSMIIENNNTVFDLETLNKQYKEEIESLKTKIRIIDRILNKNDMAQLIDIINECPAGDKCILNKIELLHAFQQLKEATSFIKQDNHNPNICSKN